MASFENIIPRKQSFEAMVMSYCDEIDEKLDNIRATNGDIIEPNNEIHHDIEAIGRLADFCSQFFAENEQQQAEVSSAIYRSICFAEQVTDIIVPGSYPYHQPDYINQAMSQYGSIDELVIDAGNYLSQRQEIDSLINYYSPHIDPTCRYHHVVETFSSMFFMLTERNIGEQRIINQINQITPEAIINRTPQV